MPFLGGTVLLYGTVALVMLSSVFCFGFQQDGSSLPDAPSATIMSYTAPQQREEASSSPSIEVIPPSQPKRILNVVPNYLAVSAGTVPPPPTPKQAFRIATKDSFDYSAVIFVGMTSLLAEGVGTHRALGKGLPGFGRYYWRGFVDRTNGNYLVDFALPTVLHQDTRYYAMGRGGFWKRSIYAATRILITPNYQGKNSLNTSELLGRAIAQGISASYYPASDRNAHDIVEKYGLAIGRDAVSNVFREFWPDFATHVLHRHP